MNKKKLAITVAACLVVGVVINVGVAWGLRYIEARWVNPPSLHSHLGFREIYNPKYPNTAGIPEAFPKAPYWRRVRSFAQTITDVSTFDPSALESARPFEWRGRRVVSWSWEQTELGWPFRSLQSRSYHIYSTDIDGQNPRDERFPSWEQYGRLPHGFEVRMPGHVAYFSATPILPGFVVNSVMYGVLTLGVILAARRLRRMWRLRRGGCPNCNYDIQQGSLCPECGWKAKPKSAEAVESA